MRYNLARQRTFHDPHPPPTSPPPLVLRPPPRLFVDLVASSLPTYLPLTAVEERHRHFYRHSSFTPRSTFLFHPLSFSHPHLLPSPAYSLSFYLLPTRFCVSTSFPLPHPRSSPLFHPSNILLTLSLPYIRLSSYPPTYFHFPAVIFNFWRYVGEICIDGNLPGF